MINNSGIDKSLYSFVAGPIVAMLLMKGWIGPDHADQYIQAIEVFLGASVLLGSLVIGSFHHTELKKNEQNSSPSPLSSTSDVVTNTVNDNPPPPPATEQQQAI